MSLAMKPACETCHGPLAHDDDAFICSYECTFCPACTRLAHRGRCPNCEGELVARPKRAIKPPPAQ